MSLAMFAVAVVVSGAAPLKIVAPGWQFTGLDRAQGEVFEDRFLTLLGQKSGLEIITQRDLAAVLGLEHQRQLLGCETTGSECVAELTSALGANAVLSGSVAKTEKSFIVTIRGVNANTGRPFATASARLSGQEALLTWLEDEAGTFAERMRESFAAWVEGKSTTPQPTFRTWPWVVAGGGLVAFATGVTLFGLSRSDLDTIRRSPPPPGDPLITGGQLKQDLGVGLGIAGVAVVALGVSLLSLTREAPVAVAVAPGPGGGWLTAGGQW